MQFGALASTVGIFYKHYSPTRGCFCSPVVDEPFSVEFGFVAPWHALVFLRMQDLGVKGSLFCWYKS